MESAISLLILIGILSGITWLIRLLGRAFGKTRAPALPTLTDVLAGEPDDPTAIPESVFRQAHALQVMIYFAATGILLIALVWSLAAHGWSVLGILLGAAELLLLFLHGAPLAVNISRTVRVTNEGIETIGLLKRRSLLWWELRSFRVAENLSRFRAEAMSHAVTFDTASFGPGPKLAMYQAIRAHLTAHQHAISTWPQGPPAIRFLKSNALSTGIFLTIAIAAAITAQGLLPTGNVLGLRCTYAGKYLLEKYSLPDRNGCVVLRVNAGTGAARAGLREGDMIVELEGTPITSGNQFTYVLEEQDKGRLDFGIIHPSETDVDHVRVTLGPSGVGPPKDEENPYFFYLRARGAPDRNAAVADYTRAIQLAPDFDIAYAYRGEQFVDLTQMSNALDDFDKALELDPGLAEGYRARSWYYIVNSDFYSAGEDAQKAIDLYECEGAFKDQNYDCHDSYINLAYAYGERGDPFSLERGVESAKQAIAFAPERPRGYYLAGYYSAALDNVDDAQRYAALYLEKAEGTDEPGGLRGWASKMMRGEGSAAGVAEPPPQNQEASSIFISPDDGAYAPPAGPLSFPTARFASDRLSENYQSYLTPDHRQLWAYIEFRNAPATNIVSFQWIQNDFVTQDGVEPWPGITNGYIWIMLSNFFVDEDTTNVLSIRFDQDVVMESQFYLRSDPFVGPVSFYSDPAATLPITIYAGSPSTIYAAFDHTAVPEGSSLIWNADLNGAPLGLGEVEVTEGGRAVVAIDVPPDVGPGVLELRISGDGVTRLRTGALAITSPEYSATPPIGIVEFFHHLSGQTLIVQKEFVTNDPEFGYQIRGINLGTQDELSVRWFLNGEPLGFAPEAFHQIDGLIQGSQQGTSGVDGYLDAGEYKLVISLKAVPVFADVVVVH